MKGKKNRGTGRKYTRKDSSKNMRRDVEVEDTARRELRNDTNKYDCRSRDNDPSWYARSPQIIRDFASLPFGNPVGSQLPGTVARLGSGSIPGIMTLFYTPTIGVANSENSAVNVAMRNIYSYVRHANSGHANYDAPDLMMYLLAMDSVYMFVSWIKRLYGQMMLSTVYNRYYPKALIESELVDYDDLAENLADFRGFINLYVAKIGSMAVPNSMSYMARHSWMTEGLYVDDPSTPKAQTYKYVPASFFQFYLDSSSTNVVGALKQTGIVYQANNTYVAKRTFADIVALGNSLINPILSNEDMNIMSGDILKAFTDSGVVKQTGISETYIVLPTYSAEVLSQMENASIYSGSLGVGVSQTTEVGTGYLVSTPIAPVRNLRNMNMEPDGTSTVAGSVIQKMVGPYQGDRLLNMHTQEVTPDMVMVATRLLNTVSTQSDLEGTTSGALLLARARMASCGSEVITSGTIWYYTFNNGAATLQNMQIATNMLYTVTIPEFSGAPGQTMTQIGLWVLPDIARLTQFDWHPLVYPTFVGWNSDAVVQENKIVQPSCMFGDVANYTTISEANISNMNDIALLSEFSVPQAGLFQ